MSHGLTLENQAPGSGFGRERGCRSLPYDLKTFAAQYIDRKSCASSGHTFRSLQTQARQAGQEVAYTRLAACPSHPVTLSMGCWTVQAFSAYTKHAISQSSCLAKNVTSVQRWRQNLVSRSQGHCGGRVDSIQWSSRVEPQQPFLVPSGPRQIFYTYPDIQ